MKSELLKSIQMMCGAAVLGLGLMSPVAQAQTTAPAAPAAGMPHSTMPGGMPHSTMPGGMMGSADMKKSMMMGMDGMQKMEMSGNTDKDFAMMMKIHHQQALDMAAVELASGKSPEMKAMAKQIITAQKKEIAQFDRWLAKQK